AIVLGTPFGGGNAEPQKLAQQSFPLGVDVNGAPKDPAPTHPGVGQLASFNLGANCPGQMDPDIGAAIWAQIRARDPDPHNQAWGPTPDDPAGGVTRYSIGARWYGTPTVRNIKTPFLIIRGALDHMIAPARSQDVYNGEKEIILLQCSSHAM